MTSQSRLEILYSHLAPALLALPILLAQAGCRHGAAPGGPGAEDHTANGEATHLIKYGQQVGIALDPASIALANVQTITVGVHDLRQTLRPTGQVAATDANVAQVTARLPGRVVQANVNVGSEVRQGQLIALVDSVDLTQAEAAYQTAQSHLNLTANQLQQQRRLAHFGTLSEQSIEDAQRAFSAAQAAVAGDAAQLKLDRTTLTNTQQLVNNGELTKKPLNDARNAYAQAQSALSAAQASVASDEAQLDLDRTTLANTTQLVANGELTRKPLNDAQSAFAQAQSAYTQSQVTAKSAKATLDRVRKLYDGGIYSKQQFEDAETAYNTAATAVEQNRTQEQLASEELERQRNIYQHNLNASSALQPAQSKLQQDEHTYNNDKVTVAVAKTALFHAREELDRQQSIFGHNLNASTALQPAQSKLQQDEHTYRNDLVTLAATRKELARANLVHKSGIPVSQALQQAQDAYDEARVALQGAANTLRLYGVSPGQGLAQLGNGHVAIPVYAPISGVVTARSLVVGQMADTSTPLVKIVNLDQVYVDAQVYEKDLTKIALGDATQISVASYPGRTFHGRIQYIGHDVNPDTRTVTVRTVLANPGWLLRPGMFATVLIGQANAPLRLVIPAQAVLQEGSRQVVYQEVAPHQFLKHVVRVGPAVNGNVPVLAGLEQGAKIVTSGNVLLQNEQQKLASEKGQS